MAKTFYGYAERQAEDNVDWSLIGKDITDMLQEEVQRRDKLKSDIDDATRKYGETLSNAPTGQHKGASDGVLEFASNAQQARLVQDRLLKSGQLKVKDYLKQRQNITDGTKGLFAAAKDFQALYQTKVDKMTEGESARLEMYLFEMSEGFGNWNTAGAYINPTTYEVSLGKKHKVKGKDGNYVYEMGDRPEEYFTIAELRNYISLDLKRFDTKGALDSAAESLGKRSNEITYQTTQGGVVGTRTISVADISGDVYKKLIAQGVLTKKQIGVIDAYKTYKETIVNEMTAIPYNELSILTDYIKVGEGSEEEAGKQFAFVWSEEERKEVEADGKEAILLEKDPQSGRPKVLLTPEQKRLDQEVTDKFVPKVERSNYYGNRQPTVNQEKNARAEQIGEDITSRVEDFIAQGFDGKYNNLEFFRNQVKDPTIHGLGIRDRDGSIDFVIEKKKGQYISIVSDINNKTPFQIADAVLGSNHFSFFPTGLQGRYNLTKNLAKRLTEGLELQPFELEDGKYPYLEVEIEEGVGEQQTQIGTKQSASNSYSTVINKKKSESGGLDQKNANRVGQALKSSYFTASGPMANIFNSDNVIVTTLTAEQVAANYDSLDSRNWVSKKTNWTALPTADYQAILIEPGDLTAFNPILLPVAKIYNSDFNLVMDMIAKEMEGGDIYDMDDIYALFTSGDDTLRKYLDAKRTGTTTEEEAETTTKTKKPSR